MAKPYRYTVENKVQLEDGTLITTQIAEFEQVRNKDGTYSSTLISSKDIVPVEQQMEYERLMMQNTGRMMSDYYANQ